MGPRTSLGESARHGNMVPAALAHAMDFSPRHRLPLRGMGMAENTRIAMNEIISTRNYCGAPRSGVFSTAVLMPAHSAISERVALRAVDRTAVENTPLPGPSLLRNSVRLIAAFCALVGMDSSIRAAGTVIIVTGAPGEAEFADDFVKQATT